MIQIILDQLKNGLQFDSGLFGKSMDLIQVSEKMASWLVVFLFLYECFGVYKRAMDNGGGDYIIFIPPLVKWVVALVMVFNIQWVFLWVDQIAIALVDMFGKTAAASAANNPLSNFQFSTDILAMIIQGLVDIICSIILFLTNIIIFGIVLIRLYVMELLFVLSPIPTVFLASDEFRGIATSFYKYFAGYAFQTSVITVVVILYPPFTDAIRKLLGAALGSSLIGNPIFDDLGLAVDPTGALTASGMGALIISTFSAVIFFVLVMGSLKYSKALFQG